MSIRKKEEMPFDFNCDVREGETTHFVVDLRWQENLAVHGRLLIDGVGAAGWSATIEAPRHADREFHLRPSVLDEEGRFAAEALPGDAKLVLRSPADVQPTRRLIAEIRVSEDRHPLEYALETGTLVGRVEQASTRLRIHHRIDPQTHFEAEFESDENAEFVFANAPTGTASLQHEFEGAFGLGWYSLQTVEVAQGETTTVE